METIISIGKPGKFDPVFGLIRFYHPQLMEPLYKVVWKDSGERVLGLGSFMDPIYAEEFVGKVRQHLIDREIENILLVNE